jgi:hypothetical protein
VNAHLACCEATRLLASYKAALSAFDAVLSPCFQHLAPDHITYEEACRAKEDAFNALRRARRAYWQHIEEHHCRAPVGLQALQTGDGRYIATSRTRLYG